MNGDGGEQSTTSAQDASPTLKFGRAVLPVDAAHNQGDVNVGVTVTALDKGIPQDLVDGGLDTSSGKDKTPYYLRAHYENLSDAKFDSPVSNDFAAMQSNGQPASKITVIGLGSFGKCDNATPPESFNHKGGAFDTCVLLLTDKGTTVDKVTWTFVNGATKATWTR